MNAEIKGEKGKMFKKYVMLALGFLMLTSIVLIPHQVLATGSGTNPPSNGAYTFIIDEGYGAFPSTLDPANCYDTASGEAIWNSMETLIFFLGEQNVMFSPMLATQVTVAPPDPASPTYTNFTVYFKIRTGVPFQNSCRTDYPSSWGNYYLTTGDVQYSLQRFLVKDYVGAATWMFSEFLLDCHVGGTSYPWGDTTAWATAINNAIQANSTHVWLNIANPGLTPRTSTPTFAPAKMFTTDDGTFDANFYSNCASMPLDYPLRILVQVMAQSWCSITSKAWVNDYINNAATWGGTYPPHPSTGTGNTQADWPGNTDPVADWINYWGWEATDSPFDKLPAAAPTPGIMCGTGPYMLEHYDSSNGWSCIKYNAYWHGWNRGTASTPPLFSPPYPPEVSSGITPAGYVTRMVIDNTKSTNGARAQDLVSGLVDMAAVSRANAWRLHYPGTSNADRNGPTAEGVRLTYPIPTLQVESQHYTFVVDPTPGNTYGKIYANDTLAADGIPANFFNNSNVRLAFTYLWNFTYNIQTLMFGEAYQPSTCAPNGLAYVNPALPKYGPDPNEAAAKAALDQAFFGGTPLNSTGFTVDLCYYDGPGGNRELSVQNLRDMINKLGTDYGLPYHATTTNIPWADFIPAIDSHVLPTFRVGWLADYADIHDFLFPYAASAGDYGKAQRVQGPLQAAIDLDLEEAARTPDGPARQALYYDAEAKLYTENPTVFIMVPIGRGYTREWVQGYPVLYNALYPGLYAYYLWKWIYIRGDVDYGGSVNMGDIVKILDAFGSYIGKSGMPVIQQRWNFHCDIDGNPQESGPNPGDGGWKDRKIDMYDVSAALANFGKTSAKWVAPP